MLFHLSRLLTARFSPSSNLLFLSYFLLASSLHVVLVPTAWWFPYVHIPGTAHVTAGQVAHATALDVWTGDVVATIDAAIRAGSLTDELLALAPMGSCVYTCCVSVYVRLLCVCQCVRLLCVSVSTAGVCPCVFP